MEVKEELLLVKGMLPEYFYGGKAEEGDVSAVGEWITVYPVTFNPATARPEVLEIMRTARTARSGGARISSFYTILASGRAEGSPTERRIKAVVKREGSGSKISFRLLYWNDNYFPYRSDYGADEMQSRPAP